MRGVAFPRLLPHGATPWQRAGRWEEALQLLELMARDGVPRDGVSYNAALDALSRGGRWEEALALLQQMQTEGAGSL